MEWGRVADEAGETTRRFGEFRAQRRGVGNLWIGEVSTQERTWNYPINNHRTMKVCFDSYRSSSATNVFAVYSINYGIRVFLYFYIRPRFAKDCSFTIVKELECVSGIMISKTVLSGHPNDPGPRSPGGHAGDVTADLASAPRGRVIVSQFQVHM